LLQNKGNKGIDLQVCIGTLNFAFFKPLLRCAAQHLWVAKSDTAYKISPQGQLQK